MTIHWLIFSPLGSWLLCAGQVVLDPRWPGWSYRLQDVTCVTCRARALDTSTAAKP